jgi:hypothetical protein
VGVLAGCRGPAAGRTRPPRRNPSAHRSGDTGRLLTVSVASTRCSAPCSMIAVSRIMPAAMLQRGYGSAPDRQRALLACKQPAGTDLASAADGT